MNGRHQQGGGTAVECKALEEVAERSRELLAGCRAPAEDGTILFTPDGMASYDALWIRDFAYMVEYAGDLMDPLEIRACIRFALDGQREDGWLPDRVNRMGKAVYAAGAEGSPVGKANLDNGPFLVAACAAYLEGLPDGEALPLIREWSHDLGRGLLCIPRSQRGLVCNDPADPHSPYGFTDTVCKTGELLMESLLLWRALRQLEALERRAGLPEKGWGAMAGVIETSLDRLFDSGKGTYLAATGICAQADVWGCLCLLYYGFPLEAGRREQVEEWLLRNLDSYVYRGQVRHLLKGEYWEKLLIEVPREEYQNGAYWATASGWLLWFLFRRDPARARTVLGELLEDFRAGDACECINEGYRKLPRFVVSATNVRGGLARAAAEWGW